MIKKVWAIFWASQGGKPKFNEKYQRIIHWPNFPLTLRFLFAASVTLRRQAL